MIRRDLRRVEKTRQRREVVVDTAMRHFPKLDVAGSSPVSRSMFRINCLGLFNPSFSTAISPPTLDVVLLNC